jgi:large subunit ribosomal protein L18e
MKIPVKDNQVLLSLIETLVKTKKPVWRKVAYELARPKRQRVEVNLSKIDQYAPVDATVIVPGKVLGSGAISKKVTVAAFTFSESAKRTISAVGGKAVTIEGLHKANPEGKGVMILK